MSLLTKNYFLYRNNSIDFLRGVSILLVLITHGFVSANITGIQYLVSDKQLGNLRSNGYLGVSMFFVISGYLVTSGLLKLYHSDKSTETKRSFASQFYAKRIGRIIPPLFLLYVVVYLLSLFPSSYLVDFKVDPKLLLVSASHAFTFTYNSFYLGVGGASPSLQHFIPLWSLSIEEVFYLALPILILILQTKKLNSFVLIGSIIYSFVYRMEHGLVSIYDFRGCVDMLAFGCLVAYYKLNQKSDLSLIYRSLLLFFSGVGLLTVLVSLPVVNNYVVAPTLIGIFSTVFLIASPSNGNVQGAKKSLRFLTFPFRLLGLLSYELYLYHLAFMHIFFQIDRQQVSNLLSSPIPMVVLISFCFFLYAFVHEPLRKILLRFFDGK